MPLAALSHQPVQDEDRFGEHVRHLGSAAVENLIAFSGNHGATHASVMAACWGLVAARLRDRDDIAIGVTVSGRTQSYPDLTRMTGPLATTVPLRQTVSPQQRMSTWIGDVHDDLILADEHSGCSTADIYAWARLPEGRALYDSVLAIANYPHEHVSHPPGDSVDHLVLDTTGIQPHGGRTRQALTLVIDMFSGLRLRLVNDREQLGDEQARDALDAFSAVLNSLKPGVDPTVGDMTAHLGALVALEENELRQRDLSQQPEAADDASADPLLGVVAAHFTELLGQRVGPDTDFLRAGGHSLLALRLVSRLREALAVDLTLSTVLRAPTPRTLSRLLRELVFDGPDSPDNPDSTQVEPLPQLPAVTRETTEPFPMTGIQQAYWIGRRDDFDLGGVDSHLYAETDIPGLDVERLTTVWQKLIDRHPMLRAVMTPDGLQRTLPAVPPYRIRTWDLRQAPDLEHQLANLRDQLSHPRRDTGVWPLFTIETALLPDGLTRLFLSFDLLIGDALSWQILYREARLLYAHPDAELPVLDVTFAAAVSHLQAVASSNRHLRDREYWRGRLPSLPAPPPLPLVVRPADTRPRFVRTRIRLSTMDLTGLRKVASAHGTTLSVLLMAVFSENLGRFTNTSAFLVNVTVYNRPAIHPQINRVVGDFTSTVLTSVNLDGATFADRLRTLQRQLWADLDHATYSGVEVLRDMREADPTMIGVPVVFTSTLDMEVPGTAPGPFPGQVVYGIGQTPQVVLDYQTYEAAGELIVNLDTVDGALPEGFVQALLDDHVLSLRALLDDPTASQRRHLVPAPEFPALPPPLGGEALLHHPFLDQVRHLPNRIALVSDGRRYTYAELHQQVQGLAHRIAAARPDGELIAVVCDPGWQQVIAALSVLAAGYAYVPVDASWPAARISDLLAATGARLVLTHVTARERATCSADRDVIVVDAEQPQDIPFAELPVRQRSSDDLAYVIYTSGSTGRPKGVMISHRGALNTVLDVNRRTGVGSDDALLMVSPFTFDLAVYDVFGGLAAGATVVVPTREERVDPGSWGRLVRAHQVTVWNSVPALLDLLLESLPEHQRSSLLSTLRVCLLSGDWIPLRLPDRLRLVAPGCRVISLGGATEGSIWSIWHDIGEVDPEWSSIPYGIAMTGQRVEILDDDLLPCPTWTPGQIHISGHGTAIGYWDAPELTAAAFVFDGRTGERWYRTGDWGRRLPDGSIEFLGRRDEQVKIRGYRVELREVESTLLALDGVEQAAVVVTGDRADRRLSAFVMSTRPLPEIRADLARRLPSHMLPSSLAALPALPLTATGKIDRSSLAHEAARLTDPVEASASLRAEGNSAARELLEALTALLPERADIDDDLLALGLTSIDVIRLANIVEKHGAPRPVLADFYRTPTLRTLLQQAAPEKQPPGEHAAVHSPWTGHAALTSIAAREHFRAARPMYPPAPEQRILPDTPPEDVQTREKRFSPREFSAQPVTAAALSRLLDSMRRVVIPGRSGFLHPSAGGLYSVQIHLHVPIGRVTGLDGGVYTYHPDAHDLIPQAPGVDLDPTSLHIGPANRALAQSAAFTLWLITDPADSAPLYGADAEALALLNAGYMGQLLCERALATGLALCPVHGVDFEPVAWLFPSGDRLVHLHTLLGGVPVRPPEEKR